MNINRLRTLFATLLILFSFSVNAFELYDAVLYNKPAGIGQITPSVDSKYYYKFNAEKSAIEKISYETGEITGTVFDSGTARNCSVKEWEGFTMSDDESKILLYTNSNPIYRHSFKADYYVYEVRHNKLMKVSVEGGEEIATMSPDARQVAYVKDNNVYI